MHTISSKSGKFTELTAEQYAVYTCCISAMPMLHKRIVFSALQLAVYIRSQWATVETAATSDVCKAFKSELQRVRRNRAARERNDAMRSMGLTKTPYGWE